MLTFDDFVIGMEQFGTRILPLMRCRRPSEQGRVMPLSAAMDRQPAVRRPRTRRTSPRLMRGRTLLDAMPCFAAVGEPSR